MKLAFSSVVSVFAADFFDFASVGISDEEDFFPSASSLYNFAQDGISYFINSSAAFEKSNDREVNFVMSISSHGTSVQRRTSSRLW